MSGSQSDFRGQSSPVPAKAGTQVWRAVVIDQLGSRLRGNGVAVRFAPSLETQ